jgi:2-methylisocitrate lyase-like PEP mutase family enzyme
MTASSSPAERFRSLHHRPTPLLLPNAWDVASAVALSKEGFGALGSTSLGVAVASGLADGHGLTRVPTLELAAALCRSVPALITMDIENGFSDRPGEVAEVCGRLEAVGVVGVNVEDGRADGTLRDPELHGRIVTAIKEAAPQLFVNARIDTHWLRTRDGRTVAESLRRASAYVDAGADGIFIPGVGDRDDLETYVRRIDAPINALFAPAGPTVDELATLGVRRISTGSLLFRAGLAAVVATMRAVRDGTPLDTGAIPTYGDLQLIPPPSGPSV